MSEATTTMTTDEREEREYRADRAGDVIPEPEDWAETLGHWVYGEDGEQYAHPVADVAEMAAAGWDPAAIRRMAGDIPAGAREELADYARDAYEAAESVVGDLRAAVSAYRAGRDDDARRLIRDAAAVEDEYGDCPTTDEVEQELFPAQETRR